MAQGITSDTLASRIDDFLASRGVRPDAAATAKGPAPAAATTEASTAPADFVCEDDVKAAVKNGRKILVGERTIITPAARDLGEAARVFEQAGWRA